MSAVTRRKISPPKQAYKWSKIANFHTTAINSFKDLNKTNIIRREIGTIKKNKTFKPKNI